MSFEARYELFEKIGQGGMARIHRARQRGAAGFARTVAVKEILPNLVANQNIVDRFIAEARIGSSLSHPNIVQVYDFGETPSGYFIAMEYLEGRSLREIAAVAAAANSAMPIGVALSLVRDLCDALDHMHTRVGSDGQALGIVHRDISLSNLFATATGHLKLIDFGIASTADFPPDPARVVGKPAYMAPETIRAQASDARVDVFATGIVAWELLVGVPLFMGRDDAGTVDNILRGRVPSISSARSDCPPDLDRVILSALEKNPDQRPASAAVLRHQIESVIRKCREDVGPLAVSKWLASLALASCRSSEPMACADTLLDDTTPPPPPPSTAAATLESATHPGLPTIAQHRLVRFAARRPTPRVGAGLFVMAAAVAIVMIAPGTQSRAAPELTWSSPERIDVAEHVEVTETRAMPEDVPPAEVATVEVATVELATAEVATVASEHESVRPQARARASAPRAAIATGRNASATMPTQAAITVERPSEAVDVTPVVASQPPVVTAIAKPVTIPPDRVTQLSGRITGLDQRRLENEGLIAKQISAVLCIDELGAVTSARLIGSAPAWFTEAVHASLRTFKFSPYQHGDRASAACFTRRLVVGERAR